jgi:peptide/nickel transport system permease protein
VNENTSVQLKRWGESVRILARHILPNLLPLVIISITLGFSGLVLVESILSYLGIGVEAGTGVGAHD